MLKKAADKRAGGGIEDIKRFCGRDEYADDLTLMVVKFLGTNSV